MIQELLIKGDDQKPNLTTSSPPSSSPPSSGESIRCPRCDSSNTKFCYYNNYNLTQPRHFCKTCRRYWTKGGALRNVPIGGGCRKNKTSSSSAVGPAAAGKLKTLTSEMARTGSLFTGFETPNFHHHHSLSVNPNLVWAPPHNNSNHFLSLLRSNHVINHHPNSHARVSGLDPNLGMGHGPSPIYRNQSSMGLGLAHGGEAQYSGMQDLYHRLRSAPGCYNLQPAENAPMIGNITSANYSSLANAAILESAPVGTAGELGFWNSNNNNNNNNNISLPAHHDVPAAANGTRAYPD